MAKEVQLKDGKRIETHTLIWAAGVRASHLLDTLDLEQDRLGRIKLSRHFRSPGIQKSM